MTETSETVYLIPLKVISVSNSNVRMTDREAGIDELAKSIQKYGLLQPVVLMGKPGNPPYELIVGQRRYLAHKKLGKKNILAVFRDVGELDAKILSLTENMHRVELNHADKAEAITELYKRYDKDERQVAEELRLPVRTIRDYIKIEERATPKAKEWLRQGKVTKADVKRVIDAAQGDDKKADRLLEEIRNLTRYERPRAVDFGKSHPKASADEIITAAKTPRLERTIILNITKEVDNALNEAEKQLLLDRESIAGMALFEWLKDNGFLSHKAEN
ncbi:MAG: ParB/RepB/Spo0J family partition protein [Candidatus Scalindua sp.]